MAKNMPSCAREESKFVVLVMKLIDWFGFWEKKSNIKESISFGATFCK